MLKFYETNEKVQTLSAQLTWSHYCLLLQIDSLAEINYYVMISEKHNLSVRQLREQIKNKEYERLPEETKNKLLAKELSDIKALIKNPITIKDNIGFEVISEKILQRLILEDLSSFLKELGDGFTFIDNELKKASHDGSIGILICKR